MISLHRALAGGAAGVLLTLAACDLALGLGDLKDRVDAPADASEVGPDTERSEDGSTPNTTPDGGRRDGGSPTSCRGATGTGIVGCGPDGKESCCATLEVEGGDFKRGNDATYPATVSDFYLDRFEITVGRLRAFVDAAVGGWRPPADSGKHVHLNDGRGLALASGGYEPGWKTEWNSQFPATLEEWDEELGAPCDNGSTYPTWTPASDGTGAAGDARPATCMSWYDAYAFCIWDGGFLPSEAEWNYAAVGGAQQRKYPWSDPPSSTSVDCSFANYGRGAFWPSNACNDAGASPVGITPKGDGRWGQADLGGNVYEWTLDAHASTYTMPCVDCLNTDAPSHRVYRGGAYSSPDSALAGAARRYNAGAFRLEYIGARCARPR